MEDLPPSSPTTGTQRLKDTARHYYLEQLEQYGTPTPPCFLSVFRV